MKPDIFKILAIEKAEQAESKKERFATNLRTMRRKEMYVKLSKHADEVKFMESIPCCEETFTINGIMA